MMHNETLLASEVLPIEARLAEKIAQKTVTVVVVGLGYVGLPFLVEKAKVGLRAIGLDKNESRVEALNAGNNYIQDVNSHELKFLVETGKLCATNDVSVLREADAIVICVPTPLDKNLCPDLSFVRSVAEDIAQHLRPGQLVSLESTTYPGTTDEVILPILERTGLIAGRDFFLAHSPERVDPGNATFNTKNTQKIVGAVDAASLRIAAAFYRLAIDQVFTVSSTKVAEMVKIYENTFRSVNIALANEVALLCDCMNVDVWEVLDAAFTKPFGIMPFYPGPGVGGHCIPIDPHYLEWKAKEYHFNTRFIALAGEINRSMPRFVVNKIARLLNECKKSVKGARILVLGMAYKHDVADYRESPALEVTLLLHRAGADVVYHDDHVPFVSDASLTLASQPLTDELISTADLVVILTWHTYMDYHRVARLASLLLDTRNVTKGIDAPHITRL